MPDLATYDLAEIGDVDRALADLDKGGSEDVAHRLAELGVFGQRDNDCACPIARYLERALPDIESVTVCNQGAYITGTVRDDLGYSWPVVVHATLPDSVSAFVEDFDQGMYPELIEQVEEVKVDADPAA